MKEYRLSIQSSNVTTTINVNLTDKEAELFKAITDSLVRQHAQNIMFVEAIA